MVPARKIVQTYFELAHVREDLLAILGYHGHVPLLILKLLGSAGTLNQDLGCVELVLDLLGVARCQDNCGCGGTTSHVASVLVWLKLLLIIVVLGLGVVGSRLRLKQSKFVGLE